ncbi:MAG: hypothetical protein EXR74_04645 [Bdellovibrionales bacterium]|nr:hypothetical protein [Bdellovibrionales bacterium]
MRLTFAVKTHGAYGYVKDNDLTERGIDMLGLGIADGASDVMDSQFVKQIYGKEMWELTFGLELQ